MDSAPVTSCEVIVTAHPYIPSSGDVQVDVQMPGRLLETKLWDWHNEINHKFKINNYYADYLVCEVYVLYKHIIIF